MRNSSLAIALTVLSTAIQACAGVGAALGTSCAVAAKDSAAVIEINGMSAASECQALVDSGQYYRSESQQEKPLVCVVELQGLKYTVRDQGAFNLVGNAICSQLTDQIPVPTLTAAPTSRTAVLCAVGVPDHDAMIEVNGQGARQSCELLVQTAGFEPRSPDPGMEALCTYEFTDGVWTVRDTGGMMYGTDICEGLEAGRMPSP